MSKAAELAALIGSGQAQGNKNFVQNGAMKVAQRGSVTGITASSYGGSDRFKISVSSHGTYTLSQSTTAPDGFVNSFKVDCTTADTSVAASSYAVVQQKIEAQNCQRLLYGTSGAKTVTISFYVRSNVTGTYSFNFYSDDTGRQIATTYTINSADTWEFKTITFVGDTVGAINNDNGEGIHVDWFLAAGSNFTSGSQTGWNAYSSNVTSYAKGHAVNLASSTDNEWMLSGVQLEIGDVATPFEHEDIGTTLAKCQRYYQSMDYYYSSGSGSSNGFYYTPLCFPITMRATPSMTASAWGSNTGNASSYHSSNLVNGWVLISAASTACIVRGNHTNAYNLLQGRGKFDAEL